MPRYLVRCTITVDSSYIIDASDRNQAEKECLEMAWEDLDYGDHEVLDAEIWSVYELPKKEENA